MATEGLSKPNRRQFDLLSLFEWMLLAGLFFGAIASGGRNCTVWYRFTTLPPDDLALQRWYKETDQVKDFAIQRDGQDVKLHTRRPLLFISESVPTPPWTELGYAGLTGGGMEYTSVSLRLHTLLLVVGVALILMFNWLRTRQSKR